MRFSLSLRKLLLSKNSAVTAALKFVLPAIAPYRPKIFGIGLPKTGTTSLGKCLDILGYRRLDFDYPAFVDLVNGRLSDVLKKTETMDSARDLPWCLIYRELADKYPDARFVLTVRKSPEAWRESLRKHNSRPENRAYRDTPVDLTQKLPNMFSYLGHSGLIDAYLAHNSAVSEFFASQSHRLLTVCWENGDGWPELCRFLDQPTPGRIAFPHENVAPAKTALNFSPTKAAVKPKVFGIGLEGSGTTTLSKCLDILYYTAPHNHVDSTNNILTGHKDDLVSSAAEYQAAVGWPWHFVYRELLERYPDAKFILTLRASTADWMKTANELQLIAEKSAGYKAINQFIERYLSDIDAGIKSSTELYQWHADNVQEFFADKPGRLLTVCWENGDAWPELCRFLAEPIPSHRRFPTEPKKLIATRGAS